MDQFRALQEVDPPDIPDSGNSTITTPTTPVTVPNPILEGFDPSLLIIGVSLAIVLIVALLVYQFYYRPVQRRLVMIDALHFNKKKIREACKGYDLGAYNKRAGGIAMIGTVIIIVGVTIGILIPIQEIGIGIIILSLFMGCLIMVLGWRELGYREINANSNTAWGHVMVHWPGEGWEPLNVKRMIPEQIIKLDDIQYQTLADQVFEAVPDDEVESYWKKFKDSDANKDASGKQILKDKDAFKVYIKSNIVARLKKKVVARFRLVDNFRILLVLNHEWVRVTTDNKVKVLDIVKEVEVKLAPLYLVYAGPATKIFETVDNSGNITVTDRTMGVFVSVFDIVMAHEQILKGHFDAPDIQDAFIAKMLHAFEQECTTAEEQDKRIRKIEEKSDEVEKGKNEKDNQHAKDFNNLTEGANFILGDTPTPTDKGIQLVTQILAILGVVMIVLYVLRIIQVA